MLRLWSGKLVEPWTLHGTSKLGIRVEFVGVAVFGFFSCLFAYYLQVSPRFAYMGFVFEFNWLRVVESVLLSIFWALLLPAGNGVVSAFLYTFMLIYIVPGMVLYAAGVASSLYVLVASAGFSILFLCSRVRVPSITLLKLSERSVVLIAFASAFFLVFSIVILGGMRYFNLDFLMVYEFRSVAAEALPSIFAYLVSPVSKVILPVGIMLAFLSGRWILLSAFILISVFLYGLTHHKSIVAMPLATILFGWFLLRHGIVRGISISFSIFFCLLFLETVYLEVTSSESLGFFSAFVLRRALLVPPLLDTFHVSFFSENPLIYWAASRITFGLVETDYDASAPFLIGLHFFGSDITSANTGYIGSGFSNAGIIGVAIYAAVIGLVISALSAIGRRAGEVFVVCVAFPVVLTALTTSDLVTVFLTHGLVALFVVLSLLPRQRPK